MEKEQILERLRVAKTAHIRWRSYAQALVAGLPVDESKVPVIHTDCEFGKWYYGIGQQLSYLPAFRAIEDPHERLHLLYMKLFKLLFNEEKATFFEKLIGASSKLIHERKVAAEGALEEMLSVSKTLIGALDSLEQAVLSSTDTHW